MPTKRLRTRPRTGAGELTTEQLFFLAHGWALDAWGVDACRDESGRFIPFPDMDAARAAWREHREEVLAACADSRTRERPWAEEQWG